MITLREAEEDSIASYDPSQLRISIFADSDAGRSSAMMVAAGIGARVLSAGTIAEGVARLDDPLALDAVLVDLRGAHDDLGDLFLSRLDACAIAQRVPVLVNCSAEMIDVAAGALSAPSAILMCQPDAADWAGALASVRAAPVALGEAIADDSLKLQRLADEVQRIARTLADLASYPAEERAGVRDANMDFRAQLAASDAPPATASDVRGIIRLRRLRDRFFTSALFADPAWDMLLDLAAARIEHTRVAVSSLCIAAAVPPTTALRWIRTMSDNGMFVRVPDPEDGRRIFIDLSEGASKGMIAYLNAAKASEGLAI